MGKVNHWKLCQRLKFGHADKWYIHKPESILENEFHKILWNFEKQTDHQVTDTRPDLVLINTKRTCQQVNFAISATHSMKIKENKKNW